MKSYEPTQDDLVRYKNDFHKCNEEIKQYDEMCDFTKYYSNHGAVERIFNYYANFELKKYTFADVTFDEFNFIEKCYNAGIMYFDKKYKDFIFKDVEQMSYGYDFKAFYPQFLNKTKIQMFKTSGRKVKIDKLNYDVKENYIMVFIK